MATRLIARGLAFLLLGLFLAGCDNRGTFGAQACASDSDERTPLDPRAAYAIYVDSNGVVLTDVEAEDLTGTDKNQMCETPAVVGPGACPTGYCARAISGKTYCLRC